MQCKHRNVSNTMFKQGHGVKRDAGGIETPPVPTPPGCVATTPPRVYAMFHTSHHLLYTKHEHPLPLSIL